MTYYDISLVDGYTVSVDVIPGIHSTTRPGDPTNPFWCKSGLCNQKNDLRTLCPPEFTQWNTDLPYSAGNKLKTACFSNCGKYEYPEAPSAACQPTDPQCQNWRKFCCQALTYGQKCTADTDCTDGGACWNSVCSCKAYYAKPPCNNASCTFPEAQPPAGSCQGCSGDDLFHQICPRAYSWPNDPQTYSCDATDYQIVFCPGGTLEPISGMGSFSPCSKLNPTDYDWSKAQVDCKNSHGQYLCAVKKDAKPTNDWACNVTNSSCAGVSCLWG